eukprot:COSAG06_NODE_37706_length_432_cov_0.618619_1_plen_26_part_10
MPPAAVTAPRRTEHPPLAAQTPTTHD